MGEKVTEADLAAKERELDDRFARIESFQKTFEEKGMDVLSGNGGPIIHTRSRAGSFEQKVLSNFGCKSVGQLISVNTCDPVKFKHVPQEYKSAVIQLKEAVDISRWIAQMFYDQPLDRDGKPRKVKGVFDHYYGKNVLEPLIKVFGSTTPGSGDEWVPTGMSSSFIEEFELEKRVVNSIRDMAIPTTPWDLPVQSSVTTARIIAEAATMTGNNFGTAKITFGATKLGEYYPLPTELDEDSAPAILALARTEITEAQIRAREQVILNGDDTGPHMDSDIVADEAQKAAKGLRRLAIDASSTVDFANAAATTAKLDEMRTLAGKFGINVRDLLFIVGVTSYNELTQITDVSTVDKFGNNATILTGTLAAFRGIPIIVTEHIREDVNATGVHDGVTTDRTYCYLINTKRFWQGIRRPIQTRVAMSEPEDDIWKLASYQRYDFQGHAQSATERSVILGFNMNT
jgi:HK97 family phage major capsid protein